MYIRTRLIDNKNTSYTFWDLTSQDDDLNILLLKLLVSIDLVVVTTIAQWLKYQICEPQIMSLNLPGPFVHINWIKIFFKSWFLFFFIF